VGPAAGVINRLFDYLGWGVSWDDYDVRDPPAYMLQGVPQQGNTMPGPTTRRVVMNLLDWRSSAWC
jgi:hypothetical protein